jgi:hypothetical protein
VLEKRGYHELVYQTNTTIATNERSFSHMDGLLPCLLTVLPSGRSIDEQFFTTWQGNLVAIFGRMATNVTVKNIPTIRDIMVIYVEVAWIE